jgi:hypothetical protein
MSEKTFLAEMIEKYPHVFARKADNMRAFPMFGIECGKGWYPILNQLFACINSHLEWINKGKDDVEKVTFVIAQIKEKFGTLRFYYDGGDEQIHGMARMAEAMSAVTCETCGNSGKFRGRGWYYTACDEHTRPEDLHSDDTEISD